MKHRITMASFTAALLLGSAVLAAEVKSGPQPGQGVGIFDPLHCTGRQAGSKACLV
jgi:hypothetical protein